MNTETDAASDTAPDTAPDTDADSHADPDAAAAHAYPNGNRVHRAGPDWRQDVGGAGPLGGARIHRNGNFRAGRPAAVPDRLAEPRTRTRGPVRQRHHGSRGRALTRLA